MRFETKDLSIKLSDGTPQDELMRHMGCGGCDSTAGHPCLAPSFEAADVSDTGSLTQLRRQMKTALQIIN